MRWIRTRSIAQTLAVQGPFAGGITTEACKIVSLATFPVVLLLLHERGAVNLFVQTSATYPRWVTQQEVEV